MNLFLRKPNDRVRAEAETGQTLRRSPGGWDRTFLGPEAIIGAEIFAATGSAIAEGGSRPGAGPALFVSFLLLAAAACIYLMFGLPLVTWIRFVVWLALGGMI